MIFYSTDVKLIHSLLML